MRHLTLSYARMRMIRGENRFSKISRFVKEIPTELVEMGGIPMPKEKESRGRTFTSRPKSAFHMKAFETKQFTQTKGGCAGPMRWGTP